MATQHKVHGRLSKPVRLIAGELIPANETEINSGRVRFYPNDRNKFML